MISKQLPNKLFPFICYFLQEYKFVAFIFILLCLSTGLYHPFNSILLKYVVNAIPSVHERGVYQLLFLVSILILNFVVFDNFNWRAIAYMQAKFAPIIVNNVVRQSTCHVLGRSHEFFQDNSSGQLAKRITNLSEGIEKLIKYIMPNFLRGICLLLSALMATYFVNPIFCLILFLWFVLVFGATVLMSRRMLALSADLANAESVVTGQLVDSFSNSSSVRIFARRFYEIARMETFFHKYQKSYSSSYFYSNLMHAVQGGLMAIAIAASSYTLVYLYSKNLVSVGDFVMILDLVVQTAYMIWFKMQVISEFTTIVGRCRNSLVELMKPVEIKDKIDAPSLKCYYGKIKFINVGFKYKEQEPLFEKKSLEIQAGQKVGLVGYSGSGKSTLVNLLLRIYDIQSGAILIDDQDILDVTQDSLRENIAVIPQDPSLFHRSLMENIRYGNIDASDIQVIEAAKKAHAHEFIENLPQGYASLVGERGVKLSGGQRQRIAIARAILKNAPILIIDEATSHLDSITESFIQSSLWGLMHGKTTIVIAHRLSTLLDMDRILVFDKGKIVGDDTHQELLAKNALYGQLWNAQVGGFLVGGGPV